LGIPVEFSNSIGMAFSIIPPGEFLMGSTEAEVMEELTAATQAKREAWYLGHVVCEKPRHRVRITSPFYLGTHEVTRHQFDAVMSGEPSRVGQGSKEDADNCVPASSVSRDDSRLFCLRLSELATERTAGREYRLPTEAEWEYACRAGTQTRFHFGDDESSLPDYAWFDVNSAGAFHPVGQKKPNAWGLFDMHGNLEEWCEDWWSEDYYTTSPLDDPPGPSSEGFGVIRGGAWSSFGPYCRSAKRRAYHTFNRNEHAGFRVVCQIKRQDVAVTVPSSSRNDATQSRTAPATIGAGQEVVPRTEPENLLGTDASCPEVALRQSSFASQKELPLAITNTVGMQMRLIPPGEFVFGPKASDRTTIAEACYVGCTEVTQGQYRSVTGKNPSHHKVDGDAAASDRLPVETVSWLDAVGFCNQLSEKEDLPAYYRLENGTAQVVGGNGYRLVGETEFNYVAYEAYVPKWQKLTEDDWDQLAWFGRNSEHRTHCVAEKSPNAFGLYDTLGNVWEFVGTPGSFVGRPFHAPAEHLAAPGGVNNGLTFRHVDVGFRIARDVPNQSELDAHKRTSEADAKQGHTDIVRSITIGTGAKPDKTIVNPATVFSEGVDNFHYLIRVDPTAETNLRVSVYVVQTDEWNDKLLYQKDNAVTQETKEVYFTLGHNAGWPKGTYRVEVAIDDRVVATQEYSVEEKSPPADPKVDAPAKPKPSTPQDVPGPEKVEGTDPTSPKAPERPKAEPEEQSLDATELPIEGVSHVSTTRRGFEVMRDLSKHPRDIGNGLTLPIPEVGGKQAKNAIWMHAPAFATLDLSPIYKSARIPTKFQAHLHIPPDRDPFSDGVVWSIEVYRDRRWEALRTTGLTKATERVELDLPPKSMGIRIVSHPGPANNESSDWSIVLDPEIVTRPRDK